MAQPPNSMLSSCGEAYWRPSSRLRVAMLRVSMFWGSELSIPVALSFVAQRLDRVQFGGGFGGIKTEDDAHRGGDAEGDGDGPQGDDGFQAGEMADGERHEDANCHADEAAAESEHDGF